MATAQQRSLRVRTRAGGDQQQQEPDIGDDNDGAESDDEKKTAAAKAGAVASSSSTWRPGRTLVWFAYLVSWAVYAYVRATMSLDLGAYSWWVEIRRQREKGEQKERKRRRPPSTPSPLPLLLTSRSLSPPSPHPNSSHRYARLAFAIEMLGAFSVAIFGFFAARRPSSPPASLRSLAAAGVAERPPLVVHVLSPSYTEPLGIVAEAVWAAHAAPLPSLGGGKGKNNRIKKTVWLLDDGNDPDKATWVAGLSKSESASSSPSSSSCVRYVSNRPKAAHELNGKASNLNHALGMIYPAGSEIGPDDLVAVFDADQVAAADFWERMLPPFVASSSSSSPSASSADSVALVLSPQRFGNVDPACDVFNHGEKRKRFFLFFFLSPSLSLSLALSLSFFLFLS